MCDGSVGPTPLRKRGHGSSGQGPSWGYQHDGTTTPYLPADMAGPRFGELPVGHRGTLPSLGLLPAAVNGNMAGHCSFQ